MLTGRAFLDVHNKTNKQDIQKNAGKEVPLFSSPSEANPLCPLAWLPPESVITITWETAAEMLQEWALSYMLHPLTKKNVYSLYVFLSCWTFCSWKKSLLIGGLDTTNR